MDKSGYTYYEYSKYNKTFVTEGIFKIMNYILHATFFIAAIIFSFR
jgi:hypothetical protein